MFHFVTGDLLQSDAYALVNTVNCEGYMGKGIAYQFKLRFPEMNTAYVKKCKGGELVPGTLHCYETENHLIINFPTKNKWREKSRIEYISSGLEELVNQIQSRQISSIAIPPLGSGNGGLNWSEVKKLMLAKLKSIEKTTEIYIYEPSRNYQAVASAEPQLSPSALILMKMKFALDQNHFNDICLQKTAYFMNILSQKEYFHFKKANYGPYDHSIDVICRNIKEFQTYYNVDSTEKAYEILLKKLISQSVEEKLSYYTPYIEKAATFTNHFETTKDVEGAATVLFIIQKQQGIKKYDIIRQFKNWSEEKAARFSENEILNAIQSLESYGLIDNTLCGYQIAEN
ncbi:MAG: macro domain-containing protein [Oscillospiraceae bacterium]|nr:macro domain-containing protein [Oscillospiraceae bacterium]